MPRLRDEPRPEGEANLVPIRRTIRFFPGARELAPAEYLTMQPAFSPCPPGVPAEFRKTSTASCVRIAS